MGGRTWISLGVCTLGLLLPAVAQAANARVRALNAGPSGAVTFRVDGVARATGLGVRRESPRFSLRPGRHTFTAVRGTRTVARRSILLGSGERVTIAYVVNRGQPELRLLREPAASSGAAQLRVANYAPRAGAVDVRAGGLVLARGLRFGATTVARRIPPGFSPTGLATIAARTRQGVDVAGTQPLVLATRSVGIFVLVPRGSGAQLLRLAYDVAPPTPTRQPAVTGTRRFGNVVRCERDTWTPRSAGIERQWTVDGAAAGSSTALALTTAAHAGHAIGCTVTATASGMTTVVRTTFALPAVPKLVGQPFVEFPAGALLPGDILTCNPGTWTVASPNFTIRWIRIGSGEEIGTGPTYILSVPADNGIVNSLGCAVAAASDGGASPPIRSSNTIALGIAPTVAIVNASKPADRTVIKDAHFQWTIGGGGADTVECSLDGGPFIQCIGQLAQAYGAAQLTTGPSGIVHTFVVRVTNPVSTATDSYSWKLEPLPPTVAINLAPTNPTTATAATFGWTVGGGGAASIACELDGDPVLCSGAGVTLPGLATDADGVSHRFIVRATNTNPTTPTTSALFDWEVRPLAPSLSGLGVNPGEGAPPGPFDLTFAVDGPTTSITCQIDGALPVIDPCTSPQSFADPGPGPHTIVVTATNITGFDTQPVDWTFVP